MKEAAGEANMTVITIVLIAIVLAVGTVIVNNLMSTTAKKSACSEIGGNLAGTTCSYKKIDGTGATCEIKKCTDGSYYCDGVTTCSTTTTTS